MNRYDVYNFGLLERPTVEEAENGEWVYYEEAKEELEWKEQVFEELLKDKIVLKELRDFWRKRYKGEY